jgi:type IV pilus assembly protein PilN
MIRINLLPHREEKRKAKRQQFYVLIGLVSVLAGLVVFLGYTLIAGYITDQEDRNAFLKKEIVELDKQIDEIKLLKEKTQALLARKQIIEALQQDRAEPVYLLSELAKQMPSGVYLRTIKQEGQKVSITGFAQSNARVSALMRNVEASPWLEKPVLLEIKATITDKRRLSEFSMIVFVKRAAAEAAGKKETPRSAGPAGSSK